MVFDFATSALYDIEVELARERVISWRMLDANVPPWRGMIADRVREVLEADSRWIEAVRSRERGRRAPRIVALPRLAQSEVPYREGDALLLEAHAADLAGVGQGMRIPGLTATVDLTRGEILRFSDRAPESTAADPNHLMAALSRLQPIEPSARYEAGFEVVGNKVSWDKWSFRLALHPRRGLELYDVTLGVEGRPIPVLYRASVAEVVTSYGDPAFVRWNPRDLGDYGLATYGRSFANPGDVFGTPHFVKVVAHDSKGRVDVLDRAIAVFERDGGVLLRHGTISARARQLVVSGFAQVDNYDYVVQWVFSQDGRIDVEIFLNGVVNFAASRQPSDPTDDWGAPASASEIAPGVTAAYHQHFFSFRLDFDVEGAVPNTVYELNAGPIETGQPSSPNDWFEVRGHILNNEQKAQRRMNLQTQRRWRVLNPASRNRLGHARGFELVPRENALPLSGTASPSRTIAGFIESHVWVSAFKVEEMYAAAEFPNVPGSPRGLPDWIADDESLEESDVVLWYTLGITHLPRPEDWPIMPAHKAGFGMVPVGFFDQNPALDRGRHGGQLP